MIKIKITSLIKTECGRAKYQELATKQGFLARLRLIWFVLIATMRDLTIDNPDQVGESKS